MDECTKNILLKARVLYKKYGIRSITMDDVAKEAGISKRTLYEHVVNKDELVRKVYFIENEERKKEISALLNEKRNAIEELFVINKHINTLLKEYNHSTDYDLKKYYPDIHKTIRDEKKDNMYHSVVRNMKKGKKEGLYRQDINEEIIAKLWISRFDKITDNEIFSIPEITSQDIFLELFTYHIRGISNKKGTELLEKILKNMKNGE